MSRRALVHVALALALLPAAARAQDDRPWRTVEFSRQLRDSLPQRVQVQYGAGRVDVRGTAEPLRYQMHLRYVEGNAVPLHRYDAEQHSVSLGVEPRLGEHPTGGGGGELRLALPQSIPLDLRLELGGTQATLELGGLRLQALRLECGAADATLAFSTPNRARLGDLDVSVGAASFTALHLANANADQMRLRGGIGTVDLDFSGTWTRDLAVATHLAAGRLILRLPADVGVRLEVKRIAAGFDHEGLEKRDDGWYSENWDSARYKLRVKAETYLGGIAVKRSRH